ncbi:MAG: DUF362 domain-containing protein [Oscillospiraceae bacterium]|nr:DUF362 domain-containing protein [Oscillospiraceae bacterium]
MSDIVVNYSSNILNGTLETLKATSLARLVKPGMRVSLKPNMVLAKHPSEGATTHSEVTEGVIVFLRELGIDNIEIIESAWLGDNTKRVYAACGYDKLSEKYGVPIYDLKDDKIRRVKVGEYTFEIFEKALATDFLINIPVLKAHCQTLMTCCMKNLKGCISDREKRNFHTLGLHRPIAMLNAAIQTGFCVVDGICGDLTFEEGGNPVTRDMIIAGQDPLLLDSYCSSLLGLNAEDIGYISIARKEGLGEIYGANTKLTELNSENKPLLTKSATGLARRLSSKINEDKACSACYSALINALHRVGGYSGEKISVGQGFIGKGGKLGCGNCTSGFERYVKGCPPKASEVCEFIYSLTAN